MTLKTIFCPACLKPLKVVGQGKLETLNEHVSCSEVSMKDKYACVSETCPTHGVVFWNEDGELYIERPYRENMEKRSKIQFIDNNDAPFETFQRKCNVEIYKKDENKMWNFGKFKVELVYCYQANEAGKILKRRRSYKIWLQDKRSGGYIQYISGIHMFFFNIKRFHRTRKFYESSHREMKEFLDRNNFMNKGEWWRVSSCWYCRMIEKFFPTEMKNGNSLAKQ